MKYRAGLVIGLIFGGIVTATDNPPKSPTTAEVLQKLQGSWQATAWQENGDKLSAEDLKNRTVFFGANIFMSRREARAVQAAAVQIDPTKSPATINFSIKEGDGKDGIMLGIYSVEGETLQLCYDRQGQNRPAEFKSESKSGFTLIRLTKVKPPADEQTEIVGEYRCGQMDGTGKLVVSEAVIEKRGDAYAVTYRTGNKLNFIGTGIRKGGTFSVVWTSGGQTGMSVYKIEPGPNLVGEYTLLGGIGVTNREVLTAVKKVD